MVEKRKIKWTPGYGGFLFNGSFLVTPCTKLGPSDGQMVVKYGVLIVLEVAGTTKSLIAKLQPDHFWTDAVLALKSLDRADSPADTDARPLCCKVLGSNAFS